MLEISGEVVRGEQDSAVAVHAVLEWDSGVFSKINDVNLVTRALGAGAYTTASLLAYHHDGPSSP